MSMTSKARRDARRKKQRKSDAQPRHALQPHATLRDARGHLLGGVGLRGREWVFVLDGKPVAATESAAMAIAMLRHVASLRGQDHADAVLACSTTLQAAATREAEAEGKTLDDYLAMLEDERVERVEDRQARDDAPGDGRDVH